MVRCQGLGDAKAFHQNETHGITQRPCLIKTTLQESQSRTMQSFVYVNHSNLKTVLDVRHEA